MNLNKREIILICRALKIAIDSEWEFIGCHKTELRRRGGQIVCSVPADHKSTVARSRRNITAFRRLMDKVAGG